MKFEQEENIDNIIEEYRKQIVERIQSLKAVITENNKIDMTDVSKQLNKLGYVQNIMKYFTLAELLFQHEKLYKKELSNLKKSIKMKLHNNSISIHNAEQLLKKKLLEINLSYEDIAELHSTIRNHSYFPNEIYCIDIEKKSGGTRTLGISKYKDKIVQSVFADILNLIYEPYFCKSSYGYRKNSNCHSLLRQLNNNAKLGNCNYILKADIEGYFDNIDHSTLLKLLNMKCKDKYFLMYIRRILQCKYCIKGKTFENAKGTPQRWHYLTSTIKYLSALCFR